MASATAPFVWVVVPTYNEADTIEPLVEAIRVELRPPRRVLVVDDSSPDGTGELADSLAERHDNVAVLHRGEKLGLGPAYLAGFRHALDGGAELIVQMDADLSHDPAELTSLVAAARHADLVVGSRYVTGGRVADWGPGRRVISRWGSRYARAVLGMRVHDMTSGFKCWRRAALEGIELDSVRSQGYAFQVEMTYRAHAAGFTVVEVPITFRDRRVGESKMTGAIVAEAALRVPALRARRRR
ncbi:MAG TPA: polyprenol monophosphomannose synthase [Solirubrobacterales bacterium]|nr:polyprenol monophosphomannose synthase [Solirubrobacterales bacterium]